MYISNNLILTDFLYLAFSKIKDLLLLRVLEVSVFFLQLIKNWVNLEQKPIPINLSLQHYFVGKETQNVCHATSLFSRKWKNVLLKLHRNDPIICEPFRA